MDRPALKEMMYGAMEEMLQNNRFYYHSSIGSNYSHFTEEGKANMAEFLELMAHEMKKCREKELDTRAKNIVMQELKREN